MPVIKKRSSKLRFEFVASQKQSTLGGLPAVLAQHARRMIARVEVAPSWLNWWQTWEARWRRSRSAGMPALSSA